MRDWQQGLTLPVAPVQLNMGIREAHLALPVVHFQINLSIFEAL